MIIDELFVSLNDNVNLKDAIQPWIPGLMDALNETLPEYTNDSIVLTADSTVKELKDNLRSLPVRVQVGIINDYIVSYGNRRRRRQDQGEAEKLELDILEKKFRYKLLKYGSMTFISLCVLFILAVIFVSIKQNQLPDKDIAVGLLNTTFEVIKLIFGAG